MMMTDLSPFAVSKVYELFIRARPLSSAGQTCARFADLFTKEHMNMIPSAVHTISRVSHVGY